MKLGVLKGVSTNVKMSVFRRTIFVRDKIPLKHTKGENTDT